MSTDIPKRTIISMAMLRKKSTEKGETTWACSADSDAAVLVSPVAPSEPAPLPPRTVEAPTKRAWSPHSIVPQPALNRESRRRLGLDLSQPALLRLADVLAIYRVSRSTWYAGIKSGLYEPGIPIGPRSVAWRSEYIRCLIENPPKFVRR